MSKPRVLLQVIKGWLIRISSSSKEKIEIIAKKKKNLIY